MYASILFAAGKVLGIIIDDLFRRCTCGGRSWWTGGDVQRAIIWGLFAVICGVCIAEIYYFLFNYTIDPFTWDDNPTPSNAQSIGDAYWFSYISLLTVGTYIVRVEMNVTIYICILLPSVETRDVRRNANFIYDVSFCRVFFTFVVFVQTQKFFFFFLT